MTKSSKPWLSLSEKLNHPPALVHAILRHHDDRLSEIESRKHPWKDYCITGISLLASLRPDLINGVLRQLGL